MDLIQQIVSNLGVQEDQAKGGTGLILQMAKDKLGDSDFAKVAEVIPGASDLLSSAPSAAGEGVGMMAALGGMAAQMGGGGMSDLLSLAGGFSKLGMDGSMVSKFVPTIMEYVQEKGGADAVGLLSNVLK